MTFKFKIGLVFAALGYAIVVTIGVQYLTLRIRPANMLLWLAPATWWVATEGEPPWTFLLTIIAPMNAALYGGIAVAIASIAQRFSARKEDS
jgi:uncharacterized membrane protein